jgi:hypothetical protein
VQYLIRGADCFELGSLLSFLAVEELDCRRDTIRCGPRWRLGELEWWVVATTPVLAEEIVVVVVTTETGTQ